MEEVTYFCPPNPPYGKHRRKIIKDWFDNNPNGRLHVNCKYRPQLNDDSDLRYLIKKGFLKQCREASFRGKNGYRFSHPYGIIPGMYKVSSKRNTYLIKNKPD